MPGEVREAAVLVPGAVKADLGRPFGHGGLPDGVTGSLDPPAGIMGSPAFPCEVSRGRVVREAPEGAGAAGWPRDGREGGRQSAQVRTVAANGRLEGAPGSAKRRRGKR